MHCTRVHRLGVQTRAKLGKRVCFWSYRQFGKEHDRQIKKNASKNAYLGSFFIPEKYVIRVLFVSTWTSLIPPLSIRVPPHGVFAQFGKVRGPILAAIKKWAIS